MDRTVAAVFDSTALEEQQLHRLRAELDFETKLKEQADIELSKNTSRIHELGSQNATAQKRLVSLHREQASLQRDLNDLRSRTAARRDSLANTEKLLVQTTKSKDEAAKKMASVSEGFVETFSNFESNASPFEALVGKVSNNIMLKKKAHASSLKASLARFHSMTPSTPEMSADGHKVITHLHRNIVALEQAILGMDKVARESEVVDLRELMGVNDLLPPIGNVE